MRDLFLDSVRFIDLWFMYFNAIILDFSNFILAPIGFYFDINVDLNVDINFDINVDLDRRHYLLSPRATKSMEATSY